MARRADIRRIPAPWGCSGKCGAPSRARWRLTAKITCSRFKRPRGLTGCPSAVVNRGYVVVDTAGLDKKPSNRAGEGRGAEASAKGAAKTGSQATGLGAPAGWSLCRSEAGPLGLQADRAARVQAAG